MNFKRIFFLSVLLFAAVSMAQKVGRVKYVFLFIGDGMAAQQLQLGEDYSQKMFGHGLLINTFPVKTETTTWAADKLVTDSAASGTAIACGTKTNYLSLGVDPLGKRIQSTAEYARDNGRKVAILTSVQLNNATPAAFYAHVKARTSYYDIGLDMIASNFDFFGGGGITSADDKKSPNYKGKDIYSLAQDAGYNVVKFDREAILALKPGQKAYAVASTEEMPYVIDLPKTSITLPELTAKAIELCDNPKGFFIMVEGGKIDWSNHYNDGAGTIGELLSFDASVKVAYDFAQKNPEDTIIVVTGDHETGGLAVNPDNLPAPGDVTLLKNQPKSIVYLWKELKAVYDRKGTFEETLAIAKNYTGLNTEPTANALTLKEDELKALRDMFNKEIKRPPTNPQLGRMYIKYFNLRAGLAWKTTGHTSTPVTTSAYGKYASYMENAKDNTLISWKLKCMVGP